MHTNIRRIVLPTLEPGQGRAGHDVIMSVIWAELGRSWHCWSPETSFLWTQVGGVLQEGSKPTVSSSRGSFFYIKLYTDSALIKLNKNSVNMELDPVSEVNTIYNSRHGTQVCLPIGREEDWRSHSGPGLVHLISIIHILIFQLSFILQSPLGDTNLLMCWYLKQSRSLASPSPCWLLLRCK